MNVSLISVRYAKALFGLAFEKQILADVYSDIQQINFQFAEVANFQAVLDSPIIKPTQKKELFIKGFGNSIHAITLDFLLLVIENQRESILKYILLDFEDLYKAHQGIKNVLMVTAVELDTKFVDDLKSIIAQELNSKIEFKAEVKPEVLGGFIIVVDGKMLDTTLLNKLRLLKKSLLA